MKKSRLISVLVVGALLFFGSAILFSSSDYSVGQNDDKKATIQFPNDQIVLADVADNLFSRNAGLSNREQIGEYEGLLFLHDEKAQHTYWMKDMLFSIDIIWIDDDIVTGFSEKLQVEDPPFTIYSSDVPVDRALEVRAGFVEENGLLVGDRLDIQLPDK